MLDDMYQDDHSADTGPKIVILWDLLKVSESWEYFKMRFPSKVDSIFRLLYNLSTV